MTTTYVVRRKGISVRLGLFLNSEVISDFFFVLILMVVKKENIKVGR